MFQSYFTVLSLLLLLSSPYSKFKHKQKEKKSSLLVLVPHSSRTLEFLPAVRDLEVLRRPYIAEIQAPGLIHGRQVLCQLINISVPNRKILISHPFIKITTCKPHVNIYGILIKDNYMFLKIHNEE